MAAPLDYRLPRAETERIADALAERFDLDPERVRCDFQNGTVEVRVEELAALLGIPASEAR
jgi:hypothetical protein